MMRCSDCNEKYEQLNYWKQNSPYKDFRRVCGNCYVTKDNIHDSEE